MFKLYFYFYFLLLNIYFVTALNGCNKEKCYEISQNAIKVEVSFQKFQIIIIFEVYIVYLKISIYSI